MKLLDYAYPLADVPTERIPAVSPAPTPDEVESRILQQVADLLDELYAWRLMRNDSRNKVYPKKKWRWKL